jgi:hypothetical protein
MFIAIGIVNEGVARSSIRSGSVDNSPVDLHMLCHIVPARPAVSWAAAGNVK